MNRIGIGVALADDAFLPGKGPKIVMKCYIQRFGYLDTTKRSRR
jgi:hypothetical protein